MSEKTRIGIIDDHVLFRKAVYLLLEHHGFAVVLEASNGAELFNALNPENLPDVVLLDISMPIMDGITATRKLREIAPSIKILVCTMNNDSSTLARSMAAGADGYLLKETHPDEMMEAIRTVAKGNPYFSKGVMKKVAEIVSGVQINGYNVNSEPLTDIEILVLQMVSKGYTIAEIADHLSVSARTVDGYKSRIMSKLGAKNMITTVTTAIRHGLIQLDSFADPIHKINKPIS